MAFEALNNAGIAGADLLVILNDNEMSISEPVGALNGYLAKLLASRLYNSVRRGGKEVLSKLPPVKELAKRWEEHMKGMVLPGTLFEEFGFNYIGPIDGHDVDIAREDARQREGAEGAATPARDHEEGLRLRARRGRPDPLPRRLEIRPGRRLRAEGRREARVHERLRRLALRHGGGGSAPRRDHAGDARGLGARPLLAGVSGALLRRRHRRAARGDVRRRARVRGHEARRRHLLDVPAARATTS